MLEVLVHMASPSFTESATAYLSLQVLWSVDCMYTLSISAVPPRPSLALLAPSALNETPLRVRKASSSWFSGRWEATRTGFSIILRQIGVFYKLSVTVSSGRTSSKYVNIVLNVHRIHKAYSGGGEEGGGKEVSWRWGERVIIYLSLHCHHQNDSCIKMGSDESHFNVSVGSDGQSHKVTVSTNHNLFEEKGEPKRYRTEVLPLTSKPAL